MGGRIYLLAICLLIGCGSTQIQTIDYPGANSKVNILKIWHKVTSGDLDNFSTIYSSEIKEGQKKPTEITLYFYAKPGNPELDGRAIIKIDNKSYELKVTDTASTIESKRSGQVGFFGIYESWKTLKGKIIITQEIEQMIKTSTNFEFVIFSGSAPTNLQVTQDQLNKVKELLNYNTK